MVQTEIISNTDLNFIQSKEKRINDIIDSLIIDIGYLSESLTQYKGQLNVNVDSAIEEADILRKYNGVTSPNTYNMPGVFASTVASYDIESSRQDQKRLEVVKQQKAESDKIKNGSFSTILQTYNKLKAGLNSFAQENQVVNKFVDELKVPN